MPSTTRRTSLGPGRYHVIGALAIAWFVARAEPTPGLHGHALVVLVALVVGAGSHIAWGFVSETEGDRRPASLIGMAAAGGVLCWASRSSPGSAFVFVAAYSAGARLSPTRAAPVVAAGILGVCVGSLAYDGSFAGTAAYAGGFVATALLGTNRRQFLARVEETELLLAQVQRSREEQVRAAALGERTRIAREVHDVLAHSLAGLTIQLDAAELLLERSDPEGRPLTHVLRAGALAREGLREAREAVGALRGDAVPLATGLRELVGDHHRTGGAGTLTVTGDAAALAPDAAWSLLRIAREAVTNVHKHAPGNVLEISLVVGPRSAELELVDRVDGDRRPDEPRGGGLAATGGGYGLRGMTERAEAIGGRVQAGPHGDGWRVVATVPVPLVGGAS